MHQLVDRITELESKLKEAGHQAGEQAGDQRTMTITDEQGNPMVVPTTHTHGHGQEGRT